MGRALEVVGFRATNPGAGTTAVTLGTGDSLTVRNFPETSPTWLRNVWGEEATAGVISVRSPRMHDQVQNLRVRPGANDPFPLLPMEFGQLLYPQDVLTVFLAGGGAEVDTGFLLVDYSDLPGSAGRFITPEQVHGQMTNLLSVEVTTATSATAGDWSGGTAIDATFDLLKANVEYAVLGYLTDVRVGAVAIRGPDTGNMRTGGPGPLAGRWVTADWFVELSKATGLPCIPVVNAANKGATFVHLADPAVGAAVNVVLILAQLAGSA